MQEIGERAGSCTLVVHEICTISGMSMPMMIVLFKKEEFEFGSAYSLLLDCAVEAGRAAEGFEPVTSFRSS